MNKVLKKLEQFGIVPVVVLEDDKDAALLAKALCDGGLACAEVTFRTAAAEESIRIMSEKFPEMVALSSALIETPGRVVQTVKIVLADNKLRGANSVPEGVAEKS